MTSEGMTGEDWHELEGFDPDAPSYPIRVRLDGKGILVFRVRDGFRGVERFCPHLKAPLQDAVLMANATVLRCSQHNFTFKLSNGRGINSPSFQLQVFDIKIENGVAYGRPVN